MNNNHINCGMRFLQGTPLSVQPSYDTIGHYERETKRGTRFVEDMAKFL